MRTKLIVIIICVIQLPLIAQTTFVSGWLLDKNTKAPVPFANIVFAHTGQGTVSDTAGYFELNTHGIEDSIQVSVMGYITKKVKIANKEMKLELTPTTYELGEVKIIPGENPSWALLRKVIMNKENNASWSYKNYQYDVYHRVQFDLNHFTEKIKKNIFLKPFEFIWDNVDTTNDGVAYLPILLTETHLQKHFRKQPRAEKTIIKGMRKHGIKGPAIGEFIEDMYVYPDIYKNYIEILGKNFPSPLNDNYKANYRFYLTDSLTIEKSRCYKVVFRPKVDVDAAFTGEMYIEDKTYAIKRIHLRFTVKANVNYVRHYDIWQEYQKVDGNHWMVSKSDVLADFTVVENMKGLTGFYGRKTSQYRNIKVNQKTKNDVFAIVDNVAVEDSAYARSEKYWKSARQEVLNQEERSIIQMVDKLEKHPKFRGLVNGINAIITGWVPLGNGVDLGNWHSFISYNEVEGTRFKFGLRIKEVVKGLSIKGYFALGTLDNRFKYHLNAQYRFGKKGSRRHLLGFQYRNDLEQQGRSENMLPLDHIISSFMNTSAIKNRIITTEYQLFFERQWFAGFSTRFAGYHRKIEPFGSYNFWKSDNTAIPQFTDAGLELSLKFFSQERNLSAAFGNGKQQRYFSNVPVFSAIYRAGIKGVLESEFESHRLKLRVEQLFRTGKWGYFDYFIEGGKIWGKLPYPLLESPIANQVVLYDDVAFNLMNYMEYIADEYLVIQLQHHFEGFIFNRIPLIKKLKLRSFIFGKAVYGGLRQNINSQFKLAEGMQPLGKPYYEVGFGVENIAKIARVDFIWRLTDLDKPNVLPFIVKPSFYFSF